VSLHGHASSQKFDHALAILAMPATSVDRIANAVVLETAVPRCRKLSVALKCEGRESPSLSQLRAYVGEVYSQLWDCVVNGDPSDELVDVVVYPANLPNAAPESWITIQKDLDCICSHSNFMGWFSTGGGRGQSYAATEGTGGLEEHVAAVNRERRERQLHPVAALGVDEKHWPMPSSAATYLRDQHVIFLEDDIPKTDSRGSSSEGVNGEDEVEADIESNVFFGGAKPDDATLFENVAVGGTFDGMHYGHRKLLTLAVSATNPLSGKLLIGVTADKMLQHKHLADLIRPFNVRRRSVLDFLGRLAPGMLNRVKVVEITDAFGPPAHDPGFDALVLSHETLETGCLLNKHRVTHGMPPLALLCTRRTEAHGMSSTALRKAQQSQEQRRQQQTM
jgi:phosphopantetheine adenylyltransferase